MSSGAVFHDVSWRRSSPVVACPGSLNSPGRRVLKPSGTLLFAEHGLAPDPGVRAWQHRLNPLWNRIGGGCNLNRKIDEMIVRSGFHLAELETEYAKGLKPLSFMYWGRGRPA